MKQIAGLLFLAQDLAHKAHLTQSVTFAQHLQLEEFYEAITDLKDELIETYQGRNGRIEIPEFDSTPSSDVEADLERIMKLIEGLRYKEIDRTDAPLQSIMDTIICRFLRTLYKLRFLK